LVATTYINARNSFCIGINNSCQNTTQEKMHYLNASNLVNINLIRIHHNFVSYRIAEQFNNSTKVTKN